MANSKPINDDIDNDLDEQGNPKSVVPDNDEYYTFDLTRGNPTEDNLEPTDISGIDPLSDDPEENAATQTGTVIYNDADIHPVNSNSGGPTSSENAITQDSESGVVPGEAGHWGVDEGTE